MKDKLWFYGSYGDNDIRITRLNQTPDKTLLKTYNAKLNWQARPERHGLGLLVPGRQDEGRPRSPGQRAPARRTPALEPGQSGGGPRRTPHGLSKVEWNHIFGPSFFLNAKGAYYNTGFGLVPQGGADEARQHRLGATTWPTGSWIRLPLPAAADGRQPRRQLLRERHGRQPRAQVRLRLPPRRGDSRQRLRRRQARGVRNNYGPTDPASRAPLVPRPHRQLRGELPERLPRRHLHQGPPDPQPGRALRPPDRATWAHHGHRATRSSRTCCPALDFAGDARRRIEWNNISPRVGFTYALDESRKTVLRGSLRPLRRPDLDRSTAPATTRSATAQLPGVRLGRPNSDQARPDGARSCSTRACCYSANIDPANPAAIDVAQPDRPRLPREPRPRGRGRPRPRAGAELRAVGVAYTWRSDRRPRPAALRASTGTPGSHADRSDYAPGASVCQRLHGTPFVSGSRQDAARAAARMLTNRPDYYAHLQRASS